MKISEKIQNFKANTLASDKLINNEGASISKVTNVEYLQNSYFEIGIAIQSKIISSNKSNFIGAYSYMNDGGYIRDNVFIGRYCSIGRRVTIGAGMHKLHSISTFPSLSNGNAKKYTPEQLEILKSASPRSQKTIIENDVWIGDGAIILPGLTISTGAVIGANSVVTRDIPPYAIATGSPAKIIKFRFNEDLASKLIATEWYEYSVDQLKNTPTGNIFEFLDYFRNPKFQFNFETFSIG